MGGLKVPIPPPLTNNKSAGPFTKADIGAVPRDEGPTKSRSPE